MNYDEINFSEQDQMSGSVFAFENVGDAVKGTYIGKKENVQTKFGEKTIYKVMNNDGVFSIFSSAILDDQFASIFLGQIIEVKMTGEKDTGKGNPMKIIQVYGRANLVNQDWIDQQKEAAAMNVGNTVDETTLDNCEIVNEPITVESNDGEIDVSTIDMTTEEAVASEVNKSAPGEIFEANNTPVAGVKSMTPLTPEQKKITIKRLATEKLGVPEAEDHTSAVMTFTKVALIDDNLDEIIKILETK